METLISKRPTLEQLAIAEERKAKKAKVDAPAAAVDQGKGQILARKWIQLPAVEYKESMKPVKVTDLECLCISLFPCHARLVMCVYSSYLHNVLFVSDVVFQG